MHIGLIGGIGPAATVVYYERIVRACAAASQALELTIAHTSASELSRNVSAGNADTQAAEFARVTHQLAAAGADLVVITSMGGHFCAPEFRALSPLPMLNGPEAVARGLNRQGIHRVGLLGTRVAMETGLYGALDGLDPIVPDGPLLTQVATDYLAMAVAGEATDQQRERLLAAGQHLIDQQGAEVVLLAGTDLSLVYDNAIVDYRVIDSALIHIDAIVEAVLQGGA